MNPEKPYSIVTSSSKGIGKAVAGELLASNHNVILNYNSDDEGAKETESQFHAQGYEDFVFIKEDLSSKEGILSFVKQCLSYSQSFSALICNTGITDKTPFAQVEYETFLKVIETNLTLPFLLVQQLKPHFQEGGNILFIGSSLGTYPHATSLSYGISKAGVESLAKNLVKEMAESKVRVNVITPGFVDTEWQKTKPPEIRASIESKIALSRFCSPEEIAHACRSVLENGYINGAKIPVDGGYSFK